MFVIDIQGFSYGRDSFLCKEIAIINCANGNFVHKIVRMPLSLELLDTKIQRHFNWLSHNIHGLDWNECRNHGGDILNYYEELADFIKKEVQQQQETVAVKGLDKKRWLERLITNNIIDLSAESEGCMNFEKLKTIFKSYHCHKHVYNNNLNCALENVHFLYNYVRYMRNNKPCSCSSSNSKANEGYDEVDWS